MKEIFLENVENCGENGGFCDEIGWKRMSLGVEEPGVEMSPTENLNVLKAVPAIS